MLLAGITVGLFFDGILGSGRITDASTQVASAANQLQSTAERIATSSEEVAAQVGTVTTPNPFLTRRGITNCYEHITNIQF